MCATREPGSGSPLCWFPARLNYRFVLGMASGVTPNLSQKKMSESVRANSLWQPLRGCTKRRTMLGCRDGERQMMVDFSKRMVMAMVNFIKDGGNGWSGGKNT